MSTKYPGGFITKSPVAPTTTAASGIWTLDQQQQYQKAGTWPSPPPYIEDVFSTYLYSGTGSNQTITNGINLSGKGGLVWLKSRSSGVYNHFLMDTTRGVQSELSTNDAYFANTANVGYDLTAFTSTGFTLGPVDKSGLNNSGSSQVSWTFREEPKFFDVVSYTGTGANRTIAHNLGSVPGCIIVKQTAPNSTNWQVYHRSLANTQYMVLNDTVAVATGATRWNSTTPTASVFSLGTDATVNDSGSTYIAYLFAHDAGGFGLTGTDNVISCGSYTGNGSSTIAIPVTLGFEAQWVMVKGTSASTNWRIADNMRGMPVSSTDPYLLANAADAEATGSSWINPTATGFNIVGTTEADVNTSGQTYIYIAIRRGPMKVPTSGTSVFSPNIATGNGTSNTLTTNFPVDLSIDQDRGGGPAYWIDRLRGGTQYFSSNSTSAESTYGSALIGFQSNTTLIDANYGSTTNSYVDWAFRRAPSFFDEVCYTGTGSNTTFTHNLTVVPELIIVKRRDTTSAWDSYSSALANTEYVVLNTTAAKATGATRWNSTTPTSSVFSVGTSTTTNASAGTYVAYLFATCAGVSKVGSYTGTGAAQTINCGFTAGSRFVMIKRTDSTGDWYVWDSARGIIPSNDPYLLINSTANEVTGTDYVDTTNVGFDITSTAPAAINANGGTFIFLAIA